MLLQKDLKIRCTVAAALQHERVHEFGGQTVDIPLGQCQQHMSRFRKSSELKKAALHAIARELTQSEIKQLSEAFFILDKWGWNADVL
jgi:hypothetical protein